jgi:hypothetical protein
MKRREFFKVTGGALGLCAVAGDIPLATGGSRESEARPVKRDP